MSSTTLTFSDRDIQFMLETLLPERSSPEAVAAVRDDEQFIATMLADERLFERLMQDEEVLVRITPRLFFAIMLEQALRDLRGVKYTVEVRLRQRVAVFDTAQVVELIASQPVRAYLADMLASFTRIESFTWPILVRPGVWHKLRFNDLDVNSLMRLGSTIQDTYRFPIYKRIADVSLFIPGVFPESVAETNTVGSRGALRSRSGISLEEYEENARRFYQLAARHDQARLLGLAEVLEQLAANVTLAEKPLQFISEHYLLLRKHTLFGV